MYTSRSTEHLNISFSIIFWENPFKWANGCRAVCVPVELVIWSPCMSLVHLLFPTSPGFPTWSLSITAHAWTRRREYLFPCSGLPEIRIISDKNYHTCHKINKIVSLSLISFILYTAFVRFSFLKLFLLNDLHLFAFWFVRKYKIGCS